MEKKITRIGDDFALNKAKAKHDFLLCIDSDGCVFDTMNAKHKLCFAPLAIEFFKIEQYKDHLYDFWQDFNLYTATRGINRFKGIVAFLEQAKKIKALHFSCEEEQMFDTYKQWTKETTSLSNKSLETFILSQDNTIAKTILAWSIAVNEKIAALKHEEKKLFINAKRLIAKASEYADIAVVSSAPGTEIHEEWSQAHLTQYVNTICTQEDGGKGKIISTLLALGYKPDNVLVIGDALSDLENAKKNACLFFPVLPDEEENSWQALETTYLDEFFSGSYKTNSEKKLIEALYKKLPST